MHDDFAGSSRRRMLALGAGSARSARPLCSRSARSQTRTVYVNSYGGVWETSWKKAFFDPFTAQTGIQIKTVPGVSFAKLKAQVQTRNYEWNVINLGDVEYGQAVARGLAREGRQDGRQDRPAAAAHGARVRHHQLFARHQSGLSQGQVSKRRAAELGRFLGRQEISRGRAACTTARSLPRLRAAGRRRAGRQALSHGYRPRLPQDERAQAAHQGVVAGGLAVAAASSATARST